MVEEWVDQACKAEGRAKTIEKAHAEASQKLKETLTRLIEAEKFWKNVEATLSSFEKQATESLEAQREAKNKLALTMVELKQTQKQLAVKDAEMAKVE